MTTINDVEQAKKLWNYMHLRQTLHKADVIIAMGCEDVRVATRAADLFHAGLGDVVVCTGKSAARTVEMLRRVHYPTEAAYFAATVQAAAVPAAKIICEDQAGNSGDNVRNTKALLGEKGYAATRVIVVAPPYSERRQLATYQAQWPEAEVQVTSPLIGFDDYPTGQLDTAYLINALVGRVQRLQVYGQNGYQKAVAVPDDIMDAYRYLVDRGYTDQLVRPVL